MGWALTLLYQRGEEQGIWEENPWDLVCREVVGLEGREAGHADGRERGPDGGGTGSGSR